MDFQVERCGLNVCHHLFLTCTFEGNVYLHTHIRLPLELRAVFLLHKFHLHRNCYALSRKYHDILTPHLHFLIVLVTVYCCQCSVRDSWQGDFSLYFWFLLCCCCRCLLSPPTQSSILCHTEFHQESSSTLPSLPLLLLQLLDWSKVLVFIFLLETTGFVFAFLSVQNNTMYARKNQIPKSFDFSTPFQSQRCAKREETAHAGDLHNEAIVEAPGCHLQCPQPLSMMICSPSNPHPPLKHQKKVVLNC